MIALFCPTCSRYLGAADVCQACGTARPAAERLPGLNQPMWKFGNASAPAGRPSILGDVMYCADKSGALYALRVTDGELLWQWNAGGPIRSGLVARGERLYLATRAGEVVALDLTPRPPSLKGKGEHDSPLLLGDGPGVRWRFPTQGGASGLSADARHVYVGDSEGFVYALRDAGTRAELAWSAPVRQAVSAAPVCWRHLLLVATSHHQGKLVALETRQGKMVWDPSVGDRGRFSPLILANEKDGSEVAVVVTEQGKAIAFGLPDGEPRWTHETRTATVAPPAAHAGKVFVGAVNGTVTALNAATGKVAWPPRALGGGSVSGLAAWEGLLLVGGQGGKLCALDAESGEECWRLDEPGGLSAGPVVAEGRAIVGSGEAGWLAIPWHAGRWAWAARWCRRRGQIAQSASFFALANDGEAAERAWFEADAPKWAAFMWKGWGEDLRAARAFRRAAEDQRAAQPGWAAAWLYQAADHFEVAGEKGDAGECRHRAARMGQFPYLKMEVVNHSLSEAGEPGTLAVRVHNIGNAPARDIHFHIGGRLARLVQGEFTQPFEATRAEVLEFENLIPVVVGSQALTIILSYADAVSEWRQTDAQISLNIVAPPPGVITVQDDTGAVIVRVPEGAARPSVRVRAVTGLVKYEIVRATNDR